MAKQHVNATINGDNIELLCDSTQTLLDVLRDELDMTGTKEGCGTGDCGACTVMLDDRPVNSCLIFSGELEGAVIETIESLHGAGGPHALQKAFVKHHGAQCGYCTPGIIMMARALLKENPAPSEDDVHFALAGNLCRCTGYQPIIKAVQHAASELEHDELVGDGHD